MVEVLGPEFAGRKNRALIMDQVGADSGVGSRRAGPETIKAIARPRCGVRYVEWIEPGAHAAAPVYIIMHGRRSSSISILT